MNSPFFQWEILEVVRSGNVRHAGNRHRFEYHHNNATIPLLSNEYLTVIGGILTFIPSVLSINRQK